MKKAKVSDILGIINKIAPPSLAESWDNPGLQVGDPASEVSRIMVALDATPAVVTSAVSCACQLLVTHHPLIFKPQKNISAATPLGSMIHAVIRGGLSVVSLHTNYDIAPGGLNDVLADKLGLSDSLPLQTTASQELVKLVVFVPEGALDHLRQAMFTYAQQMGEYRDCSFAATGEGTFTPLEGARPHIGSIGRQERVAERRLELLLDRQALPGALKSLKAVHPYEEPAFDVYPLLNQGHELGLGRVGRLEQPLSLADFAAAAARALGASGLRYVGDPDRTVRKVSLCSGSGSSLLRSAVRAGADVLLTGDVKYHEARDAEDLGIALIDAGHFSTEILMVEAVREQLEKRLNQAGFQGWEVLPCRLQLDPFRMTD